MGFIGGLTRGNCGNNGTFDDIVDLIIILIVLEFLCSCVLNDNNRC